MPEYLEFRVDKFTFRVAADRDYTPEGVWAKMEGGRVRTGLSDFLQQRSGDVAFAEIKPVGTRLEYEEEFAVIETIKVNISLGSPATGEIVEINPAMASEPDRINQDPYGDGWLGVIQPEDWESNRRQLLDAQAYLELIREQAEGEMHHR